MRKFLSILSLIGFMFSFTSCDQLQDVVDELTDSATAKIDGVQTSLGLHTQYKLQGEGDTQVAIITLANVALTEAGGKVVNLVIPASKLKAGETSEFPMTAIPGSIEDVTGSLAFCAYFPAIKVTDAVEIASTREIESAENIDRFASSSAYYLLNQGIEYSVTIDTVDEAGNISGKFAFKAGKMEGASVTEDMVTITEGTFENVSLKD